MCLAIPAKIKKINGTKAEVLQNRKKIIIDISLLDRPRAGEWVLIERKYGVKKLQDSEAKEFFDLINPAQSIGFK